MMARRKRREGEHVAGKDFGPIIRREPIKLPILPSAADDTAISAQLELRRANAAAVAYDPSREVEKEDRLDPWKSNGSLVRGGRVKDPMLRMFNQRQVTKEQMNAVEAFRDDVAVANGARGEQPEDAGVRSGYRSGLWPSERQLVALRRVSRTWDALNHEQRRIVSLIIIERRSLNDFALLSQLRRARVPALLQEVLGIFVLRHRYREKATP